MTETITTKPAVRELLLRAVHELEADLVDSGRPPLKDEVAEELADKMAAQLAKRLTWRTRPTPSRRKGNA